MSDDNACHTWVTERDELPRILRLVEEPRGDPGVPPIESCCTGEDGIGMIFRHCFNVEDQHSLGISIMTGKLDMLTETRAIGAVVVFGPPGLDLPMVWRWRESSFNQVGGETKPRTRCVHSNTEKMLVNIMSLKGWESESNIWEHGTIFGIKTVHFQMIPRDADKARIWGTSRDIFEYLAVQTTRQELHADLITFDYCEQGAANGHSRP